MNEVSIAIIPRHYESFYYYLKDISMPFTNLTLVSFDFSQNNG